MALKWFFSPKTGAKNSPANAKRLERILPNISINEVEAPVKAEGSEHNTRTQHLEDSKSSLESSEAMPSSVVVVDVVESASIVSEMDEQSMSSEEETESSKDFMSYCEKVGSGRPSPAKVESTVCATMPQESSKRMPSSFARSVSCRIMEYRKSPNRLSFAIRKKSSVGGPAADALKVSLVVPEGSPPARNRSLPTNLARSKSLVCLSSPPDKQNEQDVGCDSTTIPRGAPDLKTRDQCPELPHRKVSMSPEEIKRNREMKDSTKKTKKTKSKMTKDKSRRSNVPEEKTPEKSGPTVAPEVMKSYVNQLQTRRKKKELVRTIRGKRAEEEDTKRKQLSDQEMEEYLTIIKEVRMAKRQAKSRAMQEAIALQRADFLARLIHVSETENKAGNPITPSPSARI